MKPPSRLPGAVRELIFFGLLLIGRGSLADHYYVPSGSMEPTIQVGDRLLVDKRAYGLRVPLTHLWLTRSPPARGDVIVFEHPVTGEVLVKRLVGLPGDTVAFDGQQVLVDAAPVPQSEGPGGVLLEELGGLRHALFPSASQGPAMAPQRIPRGQYLVLGDHRGNSADSRYFGLVPERLLLGRAARVLYTGREGLSFGNRWAIPLSLASDWRLWR